MGRRVRDTEYRMDWFHTHVWWIKIGRDISDATRPPSLTAVPGT